MSRRVWCVLHRALYQQPFAGHASRQTCGYALCAAVVRYALRRFWKTRTARFLCKLASLSGNVRQRPSGGYSLVDAIGSEYYPLITHERVSKAFLALLMHLENTQHQVVTTARIQSGKSTAF